MRAKITKRLMFYLLMSWFITLQACAPKEQPTQGMKIGMHVDAVLEFVVEYPLDWIKDRRLNYGSDDGEVRWSHPADETIMLRILSYQRKDASRDPAQRLARQLPDYPDQSMILSEKRVLPAGEATHIITRTSNADIEAYLLTTSDRNYTISLVVPRETLADHSVVMTKVSQSFNFVQ